MYTFSIYTLVSIIQIANAEPLSATLELSDAFYDLDCVNGAVQVSVRTHECAETGLFSMTTTVQTKSGKRIDAELKNENPCTDTMWIASIPGLYCTSSNNPVSRVDVSAQVDRIKWKEALEATK